jgi:hypothetical protein
VNYVQSAVIIDASNCFEVITEFFSLGLPIHGRIEIALSGTQVEIIVVPGLWVPSRSLLFYSIRGLFNVRKTETHLICF